MHFKNKEPSSNKIKNKKNFSSSNPVVLFEGNINSHRYFSGIYYHLSN